jgi:hypothetical protein
MYLQQEYSAAAKNTSITFFSVFACLLLGYIYFQRIIKKEQNPVK